MLEVPDKVAFSLVRNQELFRFCQLSAFQILIHMKGGKIRGLEKRKPALPPLLGRREFELGSIFHEVTQSQYLEIFKQNGN